jgi:hypothetical protein
MIKEESFLTIFKSITGQASQDRYHRTGITGQEDIYCG